jgi:hypothetical protein
LLHISLRNLIGGKLVNWLSEQFKYDRLLGNVGKLVKRLPAQEHELKYLGNSGRLTNTL